MARGRACCEKMGIKKGPWTREEDEILVSHVQQFGHDNWRALPKQAGLLRCGKSCRLRWINYLRPDIKRGNFTLEEEETISKLHQIVGNRWSAIATKLPGRTDNEIKNLWHTRLKKKKDKESLPKQTCLQNFPLEVSNNMKTAQLSSTQDISGSLMSTSSYHYMVPKQTATHHVNISRNSETIHVNGAGENFQNLYESNDMTFWYDLLKNAGNSRN